MATTCVEFIAPMICFIMLYPCHLMTSQECSFHTFCCRLYVITGKGREVGSFCNLAQRNDDP